MERRGVNDASPLHGRLQVLRIREYLRFPDIGHDKQDDHIVRIIDSLIHPPIGETRSLANRSMFVEKPLPCAKVLDPVMDNHQAHSVTSLSTNGRREPPNQAEAS